MKNYLHTHLNQIFKLVSSLKEGEIDAEKLTELDKSLELLSHRIKTARLNWKNLDYMKKICQIAE